VPAKRNNKTFTKPLIDPNSQKKNTAKSKRRQESGRERTAQCRRGSAPRPSLPHASPTGHSPQLLLGDSLPGPPREGGPAGGWRSSVLPPAAAAVGATPWPELCCLLAVSAAANTESSGARPRLGGLLQRFHGSSEVLSNVCFVTGFTCEAGSEAIGGLHRQVEVIKS